MNGMLAARKNKQCKLISGCILLVLSTFSMFSNSKEFKYETEEYRLAQVREIIQSEKRRDLSAHTYKQENSTAPSCEVMLNDLMRGKGFTPIEPLTIFNHSYPNWNMNVSILPSTDKLKEAEEDSKPLGPFLASSLQRCSVAEAEGDLERARLLFSGVNQLIGNPPYRIYSLPEEINPFPFSRLLYWSEYDESTGKGRKGYSWVDLDSCQHTSGIQALTQSQKLRDDPQGQVAALTSYNNRLVGWKVSRGFKIELEHYENYTPGSKGESMPGTKCTWTTFDK